MTDRFWDTRTGRRAHGPVVKEEQTHGSEETRDLTTHQKAKERTFAEGLRGVPRRTQGADQDCPASSIHRGQSRAGPPLLVDGPRHPAPAEGTRLGGQGHRPLIARSPPGISRRRGFLSPKTSNTCVHLPRRGLRSQLCSSLLHKFPGSTTASSWTE